MTEAKNMTAAVIVIGNEILSGRTLDKNTQWIAETLLERGVRVVEARAIPDIKEKVVETVNALSEQVDYVFTTGGIGPTHDDITAECVAEAFGVRLETNEEAYEILLNRYGEDEFNAPRQKMAKIPVGAALIPNPVSAAPGFKIGNVHVMAGVPKIMQAMMDHIVGDLAEGQKIISNSILCSVPESQMAEGLTALDNKYPDVEIGSYPHFKAQGVGVNIVLRGFDEGLVADATREVMVLIEEKGGQPEALALQAKID